MLFKGITMQELSQFVFFLQSFKFPNSYVERGLIFKYEIQVLKPGKKI